LILIVAIIFLVRLFKITLKLILIAIAVIVALSILF